MDELNENEILKDENVESTKKVRNLKPLFGIIGGVIVLVLIVVLVLIFTSPKFTYFSLVGNTFDSFSENIEEFGDSVFGRILNVDMSKKLAIDTEVNADVETSDAEILTWLNGFDSIKLIAHENADLTNNYFDSNIKVVLNGEEFIFADLLRKNNIFSVNVDGITDGYISADNNRLSELWEKIGYQGPDKFTSQIEMLKEFELSSTEVNDLKKAMIRVGKAFTNAFGDEDFSKGEGTVSYDDKEIQAKYIDFKMNSVEMNNGVILALEQLLKEDKAIDVFLKLSNAYDSMYAQLGYEIIPFTREEFVEALNYILTEVRALEFSAEDGMVIRLYYENNDVVKAEIFNMNYTGSVLKLVAIDDGIEKYYEYTNEVQSFVDNVYVTEKGVHTHTIDINYIDYETGKFLEEYGETFVLTIDNSEDDVCKVIATSNDDVITYSLVGSISDNKKNVSFDMIGKDEISSNNVSIKVDIMEDAEFPEKVVEGSFNASVASDEELNAKKDTVIKNWNDFSTKNEDKIVQLYTAISIYMGAMM